MCRLLAVCLLALLAPVVGFSQEPVVLRIVYEETPNPPRHLGEGPLVPEPPGITVDMLRLATQRLDMKLELLRVPWSRGLYMVENGLADGIFHSSFKRDRLPIGVYPMVGDGPDVTRAIFEQRYVFYVRENSGVTWDGTVLGGAERPVGATAGYSVVDDLTALGLTVETERNQLINFRKLQEGRIDAYAELQTMADSYLAENGGPIEGIVRLDPPIVQKPYYVMLSHQFYDAHPDLSEALWDQIAEINRSDDIARIEARYRDAD